MSNLSIFCGCSYTQGIGLDLEQADPNLWVNIVHCSHPILASTNLLNVGVSGATNKDIFLSAVSSLVDNPDCRYLFVSWTSLKRLHANPSVELYNTKIYLERTDIPDICINPNITISGKYIENIRDRFFDLTHVHYDLLEILQYTNLIARLANKLNVKVFFINALLPIDSDYFKHVLDQSRLPSDTTHYTQKQLNLETRDDREYFMLYDKIHLEYKNTNGLEHNWINLDRGIRTHFYKDQGNDNLHPGIKSNQSFAEFLLEKLRITAWL